MDFKDDFKSPLHWRVYCVCSVIGVGIILATILSFVAATGCWLGFLFVILLFGLVGAMLWSLQGVPGPE